MRRSDQEELDKYPVLGPLVAVLLTLGTLVLILKAVQ